MHVQVRETNFILICLCFEDATSTSQTYGNLRPKFCISSFHCGTNCTRGTRRNMFVGKRLILWTVYNYSYSFEERVVHKIDYEFVHRKLYNRSSHSNQKLTDSTVGQPDLNMISISKRLHHQKSIVETFFQCEKTSKSEIVQQRFKETVKLRHAQNNLNLDK